MQKRNFILRTYFKLFHFIAYYRLRKNDIETSQIHAHTITTLSTGILMWAYAITAHLTISSPIPGIVGYICSLTHLLSPLLFRLTPNAFLVSNVMLGAGMIHQGTFSYFNGGFVSYMLIWFSILPLLSGLIVGKKGVIFWANMTVTVSIAFLVLYLAGYPFPNLISHKGQIIAQALIVFGYIFLSTLLIYVFLRLKENAEGLLKDQSKKIEDLFRVLFHDLANPLGRISIGLNLAKRNAENNPAQTNKGIEIAENSAKSMTDITQSVRKMYAVSRGKEELSLVMTPLNPVIEQLQDIFTTEMAKKSIEFVYDKHENKNCSVYVEPISFKNNVLSNIISNAIKFSPENSKIIVSVGIVNDSYLNLEITDQGIGIPPSILENLFVLNQRTSREGTSGEQGTGFGMPIMKSFVEMYDGQVLVESREAGEERPSGTTFKLILKGKISPEIQSSGEIN